MITVEEQLSVLADGELGNDESRFLLRRMKREQALLRRWERWHIAGAALRRDPQRALPADFSARVMAAIEEANAPLSVGRGRGRGLRHWGVGAVLAASVAAAAVFVVRPLGESEAPAGGFDAAIAGSAAADGMRPLVNPLNPVRPAMSPLPGSELLPVAVGDAPSRPWPAAALGNDPLHAAFLLPPRWQQPAVGEAEDGAAQP
ncbi:sigma-E factor negative regulatory protein [Coralloluteibacterium stylophorae]|uniref:Sigma-E factor negative regulatory protein n=1 Tax=Coralloluteibacterium stylophorae TaxID=1776034 RepID=A0AAP2FZV5_9GAMM|nr:sigma-E factor negative regulatory protein [Coralloluteibacterium stylophorae]MBS7458609.1 sigma-E factor negative regulatory protein [Coralloluteibacterium stylophorae]